MVQFKSPAVGITLHCTAQAQTRFTRRSQVAPKNRSGVGAAVLEHSRDFRAASARKSDAVHWTCWG
jgi:hypothetical protein